MDNGQQPILVTGATGRQGGATARQLLSHGYKVRALTRKPQGEKAKALAALGAEVVQGDLDDVESLKRVLDGVWGVFAVQDFIEAGLDREIEQGKRLAEIARKKNVSHFVFASVASPEPSVHFGIDLQHFEGKWWIEEAIRSLGFPSYTILRSVFFMEAFLTKYLFPEVSEGKLTVGIKPDTKFQMIATEDIGKFALLAFEKHQYLNGQTLELAGDQHTIPEVAEILSKNTGRQFQYVQVPWSEVHPVFAKTQQWWEKQGWHIDIPQLESKYGIHLTKLEEWASTTANNPSVWE
ncbi:hypothetical protein BZZ01_00325 [Nostocales cyanobacterium HT-58-2]|nr:hypothetical protein BZZ01_00325 [Nostocales cyanobacterium HT-58-2]